MNYLLDTHIWLWSLLEPERLSAKVKTALTARDARLWLSPLSVWEALLLIERSRVIVDAPGERWIREALERVPIAEAPVTHEVAFASRALKVRHRDPVDRFLAATAQVFDYTLVTADARSDSAQIDSDPTGPLVTARGQSAAPESCARCP